MKNNIKILFAIALSLILFLNMIVLVFHLGVVGIPQINLIFISITTFIGILVYMISGMFSLTTTKSLLDSNNVAFNFANFVIFTAVLYLSNISVVNLFYYFELDKIISNNNLLLSFYYIISISIEGVIYFIIYLLFYKVDINEQFIDFFKKLYIFIWYVTIFYIICVALNDIFTIFSYAIPTDAGVANQEAIEKTMESTSNNIVYIFSIAIFSPIIEEFVYRYLFLEKVLIKGFRVNLLSRNEFWDKNISDERKVKSFLIMVAFSLISGFIFASVHAMNAATFLDYFRDLLAYMGFSLGISFAYLYTRNIFVTISIHMINNCVSVYFMILLANVK